MSSARSVSAATSLPNSAAFGRAPSGCSMRSGPCPAGSARFMPALSALITRRAIDDVLKRHPALEALDLAQDQVDERARVGGGRVVRRDGHLRMAPQRALRRQRLGGKHVESSTGEEA